MLTDRQNEANCSGRQTPPAPASMEVKANLSSPQFNKANPKSAPYKFRDKINALATATKSTSHSHWRLQIPHRRSKANFRSLGLDSPGEHTQIRSGAQSRRNLPAAIPNRQQSEPKICRLYIWKQNLSHGRCNEIHIYSRWR